MDLSTAAAGLSVLTSVKSLSNDRKQDEKIENHTHETEQAMEADGGEVADKLDQLIEIEQKNKPSVGDKDAFTSATVELADGETVEVTIEPAQGFDLLVKRVYFDRHTDHSYQINVGGDVSSVSHRAKYASPRKVTQSDRVVASATNNSGSTTVVDFELEAWAEGRQ